ncbi:hypothetical protein C5749_08945 [Sphingobacterium gobiense]|uniref:Uncharacterized protein n=1 Tax=Sphingobacterium gobiense TaxID=1382456 RepID=A0A2S9JW73_9SPHI|nr:hypothetical protein C5749_08945 [Sphingobacterium gobiense]
MFTCTQQFVNAQNPFWEKVKETSPTLGVEQGTTSFILPQLKVGILHASQTIASLKLKDDQLFDYTPDELLTKRDRDKFFHLGDINLSIRPVGELSWQHYSSAEKRRPVVPLKGTQNTLAAADITPTLNNIPLKVYRYWDNINGNLSLRFVIENNTNQSFEMGSLGIPMIFNNNLDWKTLDSAHADNVFFDPYIGMGAGYLQVNRLHGDGPSLLVLPQENASFEAYNPLNSDPTPRSITFEGFHEWMVHSKAHAETEWKGVEQWNNPTSAVLKPGQSKTYALRFILAPSIKQIEEELVRQQRPVAVGAPGYVLPQNNQAKLFLKYHRKVKHMEVYPSGALSIRPAATTSNKWASYNIVGQTWGRARLTVTYTDGLVQTIHYKVIKPEQQVVSDLGHFLTTKQWYENPNDPFKRSPSIISYDYETQSQITQEQRAWYAGLSDEAGAASWLAAIMKQILIPNPVEINKIQRFANETMFGRIQHKEGKDKYGVVKSLFYYEPDSMPEGTYSDSINWNTWSAWPKKEANNIGRSYNYPHVAAAHWVLYRLARNYNKLVSDENWETYLDRAYHTALAMVEKAPHYAQFGQMEGSIFLIILTDLKKEGLHESAERLEEIMKERALHWKSLNYPFGSEMPWDSTGQEEVYLWSRYFGFDDKAQTTLHAILAYMPTVPHWGYNGSAKRYWDFVYGGKLSRIERQLHHYGSALNAIPVLTAYRSNPEDFYLLRVGHAGTMGALANVTEDGFGPAAFHSYPSTLANDGISGDYGTGFYGYAVNSGTYIIKHPEFGWLSFSGNLTETKNTVQVTLTSASRARLFLAEEKLWLTTDAGEISSLTYYPSTKEIELTISGDSVDIVPHVLLNIEGENAYIVDGVQKDKQGRYPIPNTSRKIKLIQKR